MNDPSIAKRHQRVIGFVWLLLMLATAISTWAVSGESVPAHTAAVITLLIAAFKIRLVMLHFMDLRDAPLPVRGYFEAWILVVTAAILVIYLLPAAPASP